MKTKLFTALALLALTLVASCGSTKESSTSYIEKDGAQQVVDELKADGYKPYGSYSMFTLYELVSKTRDMLLSDPERYQIIEGMGESIELSTAKNFALNNASITYATAAGSKVSGVMTTQFSNLTATTRAKIAGVYQQKVSEYMMPLLKENYVVGKEVGDLMFVRAYYIIDEVKAKEVREKAMDSAVKELVGEINLEQDFIKSISAMVEDRPNVD